MLYEFSQHSSTRLTLTRSHFTWQVAILTAALAIVLRVARNLSTNQRYVATVAALVLMAIAPLATFLLLEVPGPTELVAINWNGNVEQAISIESFAATNEIRDVTT